MQLSEKKSLGSVCWQIVNIFAHMLTAIVVFNLVWVYSAEHYSLFSWHVILCMLGFIFLMSEGILSLATHNVWSNSLPRNFQKAFHLYLLIIASAVSIAGIAIEIYQKQQGNEAHFSTNHGKIGLACLILIPFVALGGFMSRYRYPSFVKPLLLNFCHNFLSISLYVLGVTATVTGYHKYCGRYFSHEMRIFLITATVLVMIVVLWEPAKNIFGQIKALFTSFTTNNE